MKPSWERCSLLAHFDGIKRHECDEIPELEDDIPQFSGRMNKVAVELGGWEHTRKPTSFFRLSQDQELFLRAPQGYCLEHHKENKSRET